MQCNKTVQKSGAWSMAFMILFVIFLLFGCDNKQQPTRPRPVPEVSTLTVRPKKIVLSTELPGRVSAYRTAKIRPQVNGLIIKRLFTEGSRVKAGQPLYKIDPAPFQAALDNAKAALVRAQAQLPSIQSRAVRYKELLADKAVSQQNYDDAVDALAQVKANMQYWKTAMETARINLGYCSINAPISGRIGKSAVTEGAIVTAYQPVALATIRQLDPIYVEVPQSRTAMLRLKQRLSTGSVIAGASDKNTVGLILEDTSTYPFKGAVQFSEVNVDETTGSVTMQIIFPNPHQVLLPGMFVRAQIDEGINPQAILVPQEVVSRDHKGAPYVLTVNAQNIVEIKMLALDRALGNKWLVASGLISGDRIILQGRQFVRPGMTVRVASAPVTNTGSDDSTQSKTPTKGDA